MLSVHEDLHTGQKYGGELFFLQQPSTIWIPYTGGRSHLYPKCSRHPQLSMIPYPICKHCINRMRQDFYDVPWPDGPRNESQRTAHFNRGQV